MLLIYTSSDSDIPSFKAGEYFDLGHTFLLYDAGANYLVNDSSSIFTAKLISNPGNAVLYSAGSLTSVALRGIVVFSSYKIDRIGMGYKIGYFIGKTLLYTEEFNIVAGYGRKLKILSPASGGWAGGQSFSQQPIVALTDASDNTIAESIGVKASIVSSPGAFKAIRIDTNQSNTNQITSIECLKYNTTIGAGDSFSFAVHFKYEVWTSSDNVFIPLNIDNSISSHNASAKLISMAYRQSAIEFSYLIVEGDHASLLDIQGSSIVTMTSTIYDGNGRSFDLILPSNGLKKCGIIVDTSAPVIVSLKANTTSGEYGVGQAIAFTATYGYPVIVTGRPYLLLNGSSSSTNHLVAYYSRNMSDKSILEFVYVVQDMDKSDSLTLLESKIVLNESSTIQRYSDNPTINASLSILSTVVAIDSDIVIDTDRPVLNASYGVQTDKLSGQYFTGEVIYFTIQFTKSIVIIGDDIKLAFDGGVKMFALFDTLENDNLTIRFRLNVPLLANTSRLTLSKPISLLIPSDKSSRILRKSSNPTALVNVDAGHIDSSIQGNIVLGLNGYRPHVETIEVLRNDTIIDYYPDDILLIQVNFSTEAVTNCRPVLIVNAGYDAEAIYIQGNGTKSFLFQYTIVLGDHRDGLYLRYYPNALCVASSCPRISSCYIRAKASNPTLEFHLTTPKIAGSSKLEGVLIDKRVMIHPKPVCRNTSILSVNCTLASDAYAAGTVVTFYLNLEDIGIVSSISKPSIRLNNYNLARYIGGDGTKQLQFEYFVQLNDSSAGLYPLAFNFSFIDCDLANNCYIRNRLGQMIDYNTSNTIIYSQVIQLDSSAPYITTISLNNTDDKNFFGLGDDITMSVTFNRPVVFIGVKPLLALSVHDEVFYLHYIASTDRDLSLVFRTIVDITFPKGPIKFSQQYIELQDNKCQIYLKSSDLSISPNTSFHHINTSTINLHSISYSLSPTVICVHALNDSDKVYRVGDNILFRLTLSDPVNMTGYSYLLLNCGNQLRKAYLKGFMNNRSISTSDHGMTNEEFYFEYIVQDNDESIGLDYVDKYALYPGIDYYGYQGQFLVPYSSYSIHLALPEPGMNGSISFNSSICVQGAQVELLSIDFLNPSGTYGVDGRILIQLNFSGPVIVLGYPYINLNILSYQRKAVYYHKSSETSMVFEYLPQPGDYIQRLDYDTNISEYCNSVDAFQLNGGQILTYSSNPSQSVSLHLNPPQGILSGQLYKNSSNGVVTFNDLGISKMGKVYRIRFVADRPLQGYYASTSQFIFISFSNEYELRGFDDEYGINRRIGEAVAISNDIAVVGAPGYNMSTITVQSVTTIGFSIESQKEIQVLGIHVVQRPVILSFYSTAAIDAAVGGSFAITIGTHGRSRDIPANVATEMLIAILNYDFPFLGSLSITREVYAYCACSGAFTWTITFKDVAYGAYDDIYFDSSLMTGENAAIIGPNILQYPAMIFGNMILYQESDSSNVYSLPFDATGKEFITAFQSFDVSVEHVDERYDGISGARTWTIFFDSWNSSNDIPTFLLNTSQLTGGEINSWNQVLQEGVDGLSSLAGYFQLGYRNEYTISLSSDITAEGLKEALEDLNYINRVDVYRSQSSDTGGYTWTINFLSVNSLTVSGYAFDPAGSVPLLSYKNNLRGANASIAVKYDRIGSYGINAGKVLIYQNIDDTWTRIASLIGQDTQSNDQFGSSVYISDSLIIVGAISATKKSVSTIQTLSCSSDGEGYFILQHGGYDSPLISSQIYYSEFVGLLSDTFLSINSLHIDDWGNISVCSNTSFNITYQSKRSWEGDVISIANYTFDSYVNISLSLKREEILIESAEPYGSVYIFRNIDDCSNNASLCLKQSWQQEAQLFPNSVVGLERFGQAVCITSQGWAFIGCPGCMEQEGMIFVYRYIDGSWTLNQKLFNPRWVIGDDYGFSLNSHGLSLIAGSPSANNHSGCSYFYERIDGSLLFSRLNDVCAIDLNISDPIKFGYSVAIDNKTAVIGAPLSSNYSVYNGLSKSFSIASGQVYVFERTVSRSSYDFKQILIPTNIKTYDRFGYQVYLQDDVIIASTWEDFIGNLTPSHVVIAVEVGSESSDSIGGSFRLIWKYNYSTSSYNSSIPLATRSIKYNESAIDMKSILENDLNLDTWLLSDSCKALSNTIEEAVCSIETNNDNNCPISVTRKSTISGGYIWMITFQGGDTSVNLFESDISTLTGVGAYVRVSYVYPSPETLRGNVHVFQKESVNNTFIEELIVSPHQYQSNDRCGVSIALSGQNLLVGCPNRNDLIATFDGASYVFNLNLLSIRFASSSNTVIEGAIYSSQIQRRNLKNDNSSIPFYIKTLDRNSDAFMQAFYQDFYDIQSGDTMYSSTVLDYVGLSGQAIAKYSTDSDPRWIGGTFDYRGIADYTPIYEPKILFNEDIFLSIATTADNILEVPDETLSMVIFSPGLWASPLGSLFKEIIIVDNNTGVVEDELYFAKIRPQSIDTSVCESHAVRMTSVDLVTSYPSCPVDGVEDRGVVLHYELIDNDWTQRSILTSPHNISSSRYFGNEISIFRFINRNDTLLAISESYGSMVYLYSAMNGQPFTLDQTISVEEAYLPQHSFGGSLALSGNMLAIGASGLESVYIYVRSFDSYNQSWIWTLKSTLQSSETDYDYMYTTPVYHRQRFGYAVNLNSNRVLVVGSPYANYGKLGTDQVEVNWKTEGDGIESYGKGKAYVFYSPPRIIKVTVHSPIRIAHGTFRLSYNSSDMIRISESINITSTAYDMKTVLECMENIEKVSVSFIAYSNESYDYNWLITFPSVWDEYDTLTPKWYDNGCETCIPFNVSGNTSSVSIVSKVINASTSFSEVQILQAADGYSGDMYGAVIAMNDQTLCISASASAAIATTDWDFESGTLNGWTATGTAFQSQPTYGDNSRYRLDQSITSSSLAISHVVQGESSNLQGMYYIGTFEMHPGNLSDYLVPNSNYFRGSSQGNGPQGTLTSQVFQILGSSIAFLIGGGCDEAKVFVELVVDDVTVAKATGQCREKMRRQTFNVSPYIGRAAYIRIVDHSSSDWGHINVDDISFDWDVIGGSYATTSKKVISTGKVETPNCGAVYVYRYIEKNNVNNCLTNDDACEWMFETRLMASDKRSFDRFGSSIALSDDIIAIGAPQANLLGIYKDFLSIYPFTSYNKYPLNASTTNQNLFYADSSYSSISSSSKAVWQLSSQNNISIIEKSLYEDYGAVYLYRKQSAIITVNGSVMEGPYWLATDSIKMQPYDGNVNERYGSSLAMSNGILAVTSPGNRHQVTYTYDTSPFAIRFSSEEYSVTEGIDSEAHVILLRTEKGSSVAIHYATSDLTAKGISPSTYDSCMALPTNERFYSNCGDYMHVTGVLHMSSEMTSIGFRIPVVNNHCRSKYTRFAQVMASINFHVVLLVEMH